MRASISVLIFLLIALSPPLAAAQNCTVCHRSVVSGVHGDLECTACHGAEGQIARPAAAEGGAAGCVVCHQGYQELFQHNMATRAVEQEFVRQSYGQHDPQFFASNCASCHVRDCLDCHGGEGHRIARPTKEACLSCHQGYFVGADYYGRAPREDNLRYQRGAKVAGQTALKMRPDLHAELGMTCGSCHSMASLALGKKTDKNCRDCHTPNLAVLEHGIAAHMEQLECVACHAAWAAQEYGSFFVRLGGRDAEARAYFRVRQDPGSEYARSAYLRKQDAPPLGLNAAGKVAPVRPQFIALLSDVRPEVEDPVQNRLLAARWKPFFPHTVRSGTVMCEGCHEDERRFLLEKEDERIYQLRQDDLPLDSFWMQQGQSVAGGAFFPAERFEQLQKKSPDYVRGVVEKWKRLVESVAASSEK